MHPELPENSWVETNNFYGLITSLEAYRYPNCQHSVGDESAVVRLLSSKLEGGVECRVLAGSRHSRVTDYPFGKSHVANIAQ